MLANLCYATYAEMLTTMLCHFTRLYVLLSQCDGTKMLFVYDKIGVEKEVFISLVLLFEVLE